MHVNSYISKFVKYMAGVTWLHLLIFDEVIRTCNGKDIFASTAQMKDLHRTEQKIWKGIDKYLEFEEQRIRELRSYFQEYHEEYQKAKHNIIHPIEAFLLLKRWTALKKLTSSQYKKDTNEFQEKLYEETSKSDVGDVDLLHAEEGLIRLQQVYDLSTDDLTQGTVLGHNASAPLTPNDMFSLALRASSKRDHKLTVEWLFKAQDAGYEPKYRLLYYLATAHDKAGDFVSALRYIKAAHQLKHDDIEINEALKDYRNKNVNISKYPPPLRNISDWKRALSSVYKQYKGLCNGKIQNNQTKMFCRYHSTYVPYYKIKEEVLSVDPWISMFYEIIHKKESYFLKHIGLKNLKRASVSGLNKTISSDMRISKTSWLYDNKHPEIRRLSKRVELITGLSVEWNGKRSSAEAFQLVNYGLGGQYEPHPDFFRTEQKRKKLDPSNLRDSGDRLATFLFYLSDVEAGGATVFPRINIRVPVIKGAAAFWYNLKRNGAKDWNTEHAGCPVLYGDKWVVNKWIREYGQEFKRKCGLTYHATQE